MIFDPDALRKMTEADVRAEILDPIVARLGYRFGGTYYVERERTLRYPYGYVGHKSKRDVPLGAADYVCGIDGRRGSFAVEAKRGNHDITLEDIEQAHSYAAHPEIRADFFVLSNGSLFNIYETMRGVNDSPILSLNNKDIEDLFHQIEAILRPDCLEKNCTKLYDLGLPLANGYGSSATLGSGWLQVKGFECYFDCSEDDPLLLYIKGMGLLDQIDSQVRQLTKYRQPITGGRLARYDDGSVFADVKFGSIHELLEHNMIALNLQEISFFSNSPQIEVNIPTIFETLREDIIPVGTELYDAMSEKMSSLNIETLLTLYYRAMGYLADDKFRGDFSGLAIYEFKNPLFPVPPLVSKYDGEFEIGVSAS